MKFYILLVTLVLASFSVNGLMDPTCQRPPNEKEPKKCCNIPSLFPETVFAKCMTENPMPPMPPAAGKIEGCVSLISFFKN
jgi:hypothetical protein